MNAIITIAGWIMGGWRWIRGHADPTGDATVDDELVALQHESESDAAQLLDHSAPATRDTGDADQPDPERDNQPDPAIVALPPDPERDDGGGRQIRVLIGPRIDGNTSWEIESPGGRRFAAWGGLKRAAERGCSVVHIAGLPYELGRGKPGSGRLHVSSTFTRVDVRPAWAEIAIKAEGAEVEGVDQWAHRELPRLAGWLLGVDLADLDELEQLDLVRQRRIEQCTDFAGVSVEPGDERGMVSRASKWSRWLDDGDGREGFGAGDRSTTPSSVGVYGKRGDLRRQRGPEHAALLAMLVDAGLGEDEDHVRVDVRAWGDALRLTGPDGRQWDGTKLRAALDPELRAVLWLDGLTRHWLAQPRPEYFERLQAWIEAGRPKGAKPRLRDEPVHPLWVAAREAVDAGVGSGPLRTTRDLRARQRDAVERNAVRRLAVAGADVEDLRGDGGAARTLEQVQADTDEWGKLLERARARHRDLDELVEDDERGEP